MTEQQAEAVVRLQLGQLAACLNRMRFSRNIRSCGSRFAVTRPCSPTRRTSLRIIRADLEQMAAKYGDDRKTEITDDGADVDIEDLIEDEPNVVTVTHEGFVKRMPLTEYRVQGRGGKGVQGACARTTSSSTSSSHPRRRTCSVSPTPGNVTGSRSTRSPRHRGLPPAVRSPTFFRSSPRRRLRASCRSASSRRATTFSWRRARGR